MKEANLLCFRQFFLTELIQRSFSTTSKSQASASSALSACWRSHDSVLIFQMLKALCFGKSRNLFSDTSKFRSLAVQVAGIELRRGRGCDFARVSDATLVEVLEEMCCVSEAVSFRLHGSAAFAAL